MTTKRRSKAVLIGAGFSGIATAITLKDKLDCNDFVIYERHEDIGGTWHANTYPGCASDVPAPWYSLSTDLNPNWTKFNPPHSEMKSYLKNVCDNHQLWDNIKKNCWVESLYWNDTTKEWKLKIEDKTTGEIIEHISKLLFTCQGALVYPNKMQMEGLETFKGDYWHTGNWNHDVDLTNKNVVIIGNGCSAAQVVPHIVDKTKSLTQIQRSKQWYSPPPPAGGFNLFQKLNSTEWGMRLMRYLIFFGSELKAPLFNSENMFSGIAERHYTKTAVNYIKETAPEKYHDLLLPDFKFGCKRTIFDPGYLNSLHNEKMDLVQESITQITESAVHTDQGTHPADVIIFATGYDVKEGITKLDIHGRNESLVLKWKREGISAYDTILVEDFPNMFMLAGPNFATGHSSVVFAIENAQMFIEQVAGPVVKGEKSTVEVTSEAYQTWKTRMGEALSKTVFSSPYGGCVSWYRAQGENNYVTYPWTQLTYYFRMLWPTWKDLKIE